MNLASPSTVSRGDKRVWKCIPIPNGLGGKAISVSNGNLICQFLQRLTRGLRSSVDILALNKGIEFIDLPSIFKDRSVTSSIPAYFQNSEPPIICYKNNKPIRNTVFNFNKLVSDLDIHANTPES